VESDALDDAGDFLHCVPAFRDCGIHALLGFGCPEGFGWFGRIRLSRRLLGPTLRGIVSGRRGRARRVLGTAI
jgi:hypothetical protein